MGAKADYVAQFHKGPRVLVIGRPEIGEWTTREGETRTSYDIWADDVVNLSPREEGSRAQGRGLDELGAERSTSSAIWRGQQPAARTRTSTTCPSDLVGGVWGLTSGAPIGSR